MATRKDGMNGQQMDIFSYQKKMEQQKVKQLKKKSTHENEMVFHYDIFQKAYLVLKQKNCIEHIAILECKVQVSYPVYESIYLQALRKVYLCCKKRVENDKYIELLSDMYEKEFDWMSQKMAVLHSTDTA